MESYCVRFCEEDVDGPPKMRSQNYCQKPGKQLPSYRPIHEGPPHLGKFKSVVTVDGQQFESPQFCYTEGGRSCCCKTRFGVVTSTSKSTSVNCLTGNPTFAECKGHTAEGSPFAEST
ncbi:hypothetical protein EJB05_14134, partial [Eragrostis curvula]